jgi:hypothetical protein
MMLPFVAGLVLGCLVTRRSCGALVRYYQFRMHRAWDAQADALDEIARAGETTAALRQHVADLTAEVEGVWHDYDAMLADPRVYLDCRDAYYGAQERAMEDIFGPVAAVAFAPADPSDN